MSENPTKADGLFDSGFPNSGATLTAEFNIASAELPVPKMRADDTPDQYRSRVIAAGNIAIGLIREHSDALNKAVTQDNNKALTGYKKKLHRTKKRIEAHGWEQVLNLAGTNQTDTPTLQIEQAEQSRKKPDRFRSDDRFDVERRQLEIRAWHESRKANKSSIT